METQKRYVRSGYERDYGDELAEEHVKTLLPGVVEAARTAIQADHFYVDSTAAQ